MGALIRAAAVVAAIGAAAAVLLVVAHHTSSPPSQAAGAPTVRTSYEPPAAQFGDLLTLHIAARLDNRTLLPGTFRLTSGVAPLTQLGRTTTTRTTRGHVTVISVSIPTVCIVNACVAGRGETRIRLPVVTAVVTGTDGRPRPISTTWPKLLIGSRVTTADLARKAPPLRADTVPAAATYRIAPRRLGWLLDGAAVLLAAAGIWFGARQIAAIVRARRMPAEVDPLAEALRYLREAGSRQAPDRRRALGLLARVLERRGLEQADASNELAWSRPAPSAESAAELASQIDERART
ncbi:MAG TPA: hypothetical protein VFB17_02265 [Gaiellaceae bacterium]|nr:hypothetical protein [Gaiellaceae bacterium]